MTFQEAANYLLGAINETVSRRNPGRLERMEAFLRHLGDPHLRYPTIHVGGTSGKGSTAIMLATALTVSGKTVGLHTKPHLSSMTERARIDGRSISEARFAQILTQMLPAIEAATREQGRPSYYETLLALALTYFADEGVDLAVVEVGVGGRLDGTNLLQPEVSIITNVGLDHTDVLGDTLELIARDKAGIAKPGVPLVSGAAPGPRAVIEESCAMSGAPFFAVAEHARVEPRQSEPYGQSFAVTTERGSYELALPVLGGFQQHNAAAAIVALERLREDLQPSIDEVERAFAQLVIPGRMEFFPSFPSVVFDVAHNPDKAASLAEALVETFPGRRFTFIVAITDTKDALGILRPWFELSASFIFTSFEAAGRTAARPLRLVNIAQLAGVSARAIADPGEALSIARRNADASHIVVVTGSTFVAGLLRDWWFEHVGERSRN